MASFEQLGIAQDQVQSLRSEGIQEATPIQEGAIPVIMQGSDVICQAQTGTGKTLAFLLPMLERIKPDRDELQGLILTPTRELALQITTELKKRVAVRKEVSVLAVYGGQDVESQLRKLKRAVHIVVATPGRLLDHIRRGTVKLGAVKMLVLDEADQMLHMGFLTEVEEILNQMPYRKQTMLFSATMPGGVRSLASRFMIEPKDITVRAPQVTVKAIRQLAVEVSARNKEEQLKRLLEEHNPYLGVIFCRTKKRASAVNDYLQENGFNSDELHGDLSQAKREQVMKRFREAKLHVLVATDVAARGLDVEGVTHVFNYDIPENAESYIHRIGRTGRAGEAGFAITLVSPHDRHELAAIERGIHQTIPRENINGGKGRNYPEASDLLLDEKPERQGGARRGAPRRGGAASGGGQRAAKSGGRSGQQGRGGRGGEKRAGSGGGAFASAAKRGDARGGSARGGADETPQWGSAARAAEAPRGRGGATARDSAAAGGRGRYSTPAREEGARGSAGERGREGGARGGAARGGKRADAPQFPNTGGAGGGRGVRSAGESGARGGRSNGEGGARGGRSASGGRPASGGSSFKGGRSGGGKQGPGGRPQRTRSR
nr:DEAD/DEAH box helicase [Paenibacillus silvisoli]